MPLQKPNVKAPPPQQTASQKMQAYGNQLSQWLFGTTLSIAKFKTIVENNIEVGKRHFKAGNLKDAELRFKLATWINAKSAEGWYWLGRSYLAQGKKMQAAQALNRALALKPGHEETLYMLALSVKKMPAEAAPKKMPLSLVLEHFESRARAYDREQLDVLKYQGHILLGQALRKAMVPGRIDHVVLDMGAGTGLVATQLREVSAHVVGVDISSSMLAVAMARKDAAGKKLYDALIKRELQEFLEAASPASYDVVVAGDVLSYIGEAQPLFSHVARVLKPGGFFALTADKQDAPGFSFASEQARFAYSSDYVRSLASQNGLSIIALEEAQVYGDRSMWLCVFKK